MVLARDASAASAALAVSAILAAVPAQGCTNILVGKHASTTGSPQIAYTSDAGFQYGAMGHYQAADHPAGARRMIFNEDSGLYLGSIPEAPHTYNALAFHGGHERTPAVHWRSVRAKVLLTPGLPQLHGQNGTIDYGSLMDLALQRCKTAREAIAFIDSITAEHGPPPTALPSLQHDHPS
eukprot:gene12458-2272_t